MTSALIGVGISVLCLVPPLIHFVSGPLGPAIGGFIGGARIKTRGKWVVALGVTMGAGAALIGVIVMLVARLFGVSPSDGSMVPAIVEMVVFTYVFTLGSLGAWFGGRG